MNFSFELELEVEIEGEYRPGTRDTRSWECPMGYPGDPEEFEIKAVWLGSGANKVNIIDHLTESQIRAIEELGVEYGKEESEEYEE